MNSLEFPSKNLIIEFPEDWDECNIYQVNSILEMAFRVMNGTMSMLDFKIKMFSELTGIKFGLVHFVREKLGMNKLINEKVFHISDQLCNWVFLKNADGDLELNYQTIKNNFPVLQERYFGPDDLLANLTLNEFKTALSFLNQYFELRNEQDQSLLYLNYFIATLYRPKGITGERLPFFKYIIEPSLFENVSNWKKQIIAIWFSFCVKCLQREDILIDGIEVNLSILFPETSPNHLSNKSVNLGWTGIILDVAESGVFGDTESTGNALLYDVLLYLLKKHQDQPKQK